MAAAISIFQLTTFQSHKIKLEVTRDRSRKMELNWKPITNSNNVIHLVENYTSSTTYWESLCGRRGSKKVSDYLQEVEGQRTCCGVCTAMQRKKIQSKSLLEASFKVS